jgi:hypothetical protein
LRVLRVLRERIKQNKMNNQAAKLLIHAVSRAEISNLPTEIETQVFGDLAVFYSQTTEISHNVATLKKYHDIISELHSAITIVPFRYGSVVENLQTWVEEEKEKYLELLEKLDGLTEMSLRIIVPNIESQESAKPLSGKDYLLKKSRQYQQSEQVSEIIAILKTNLKEFICDLKHEKHNEILSVYFLIKKTEVEQFRREFSKTEKAIQFKSVLTGGWCPFNFCTSDV